MKKVLLVYNPVSGTGKIASRLDRFVNHFQKKNIFIMPVSTPFKEEVLLSLLGEGFEYVLAAGGDGTFHRVVNCLLKHDSPPPLGLIPAGTANDFAVNLGLPDLETTLKVLDFKQTVAVDVGRIGGSCFINVASAGLLTDISYKMDQRLKNTLGRLAYYLKGVAELPNFKSVPVEVKRRDREIFSGEVLLFLILNGKGAGNFRSVAPRASLNDGLLDCIFFKKSPVIDFLNLVFKVAAGKHLDDPNILYVQLDSMSVHSPEKIGTDLDGEEGPPLPWQVDVLPRKLQILKPQK
jgi:diacylglycerol kinase (ATP)